MQRVKVIVKMFEGNKDKPYPGTSSEWDSFTYCFRPVGQRSVNFRFRYVREVFLDVEGYPYSVFGVTAYYPLEQGGYRKAGFWEVDSRSILYQPDMGENVFRACDKQARLRAMALESLFLRLFPWSQPPQ